VRRQSATSLSCCLYSEPLSLNFNSTILTVTLLYSTVVELASKIIIVSIAVVCGIMMPKSIVGSAIPVLSKIGIAVLQCIEVSPNTVVSPCCVVCSDSHGKTAVDLAWHPIMKEALLQTPILSDSSLDKVSSL